MTESTLLIFDIDGTLCQTKEIGDNSFIKVFEKMYKCHLNNIEWENFPNVTDAALYSDLFELNFARTPTKIEFEDFKLNYFNDLVRIIDLDPSKFKIVEGANEFLSNCMHQHLPIAIATGSWLNIALLKMEACHLIFNNIPITSSDDSYRRAEIVELVIEKSKIHYAKSFFDKIIYFGDGLWDKNCCEELGIDFIGIDIDNNYKLKTAGVKLIYPDFKNIPLC